MDEIVYRDQRFTLGKDNGTVYLICAGEKFRLTSHPFEPCLFVTGENGFTTVVHNAFIPEIVLESFVKGDKVSSITGREYDAKDFCEMAASVARMGDVNIDDAEKALPENSIQNPAVRSSEAGTEAKKQSENGPASSSLPQGSTPDDPFYAVLAEYPDSAVDFCIVKTGTPYAGRKSHHHALATAAAALFTDGGETIWHYDAEKAVGKPIIAQMLFSRDAGTERLCYRNAFLHPPYDVGYSEDDFNRINAALFPNGTDGLEVFEWSTDWSDYFDDGREWWGTMCLTVYDRSLDRFVAIFASATD